MDEAIPGERVEARVFRRHRRETWGVVEKVLDPSPLRVKPECPVFGVCGGCQWQHLSSKGQEAAKGRFLEETLKAQGITGEGEVTAEAGTKSAEANDGSLLEIGFAKAEQGAKAIRPGGAYGYRTKAEQELAVREGHVVWGIHQQRGFRIADGRECRIHRPEVHELVNFVGSLLDKPEHLHLVAQHWGKGGPLRGFLVRISASTGQALVVFFTGPGEFPEIQRWTGEILSAYADDAPSPEGRGKGEGKRPKVAGVLRNISSLESGTLYGPETQVLWGSPEIEEEIGGDRYILGFEDFFQSSPEAALALQNEVLSAFPNPPTSLPPHPPVLDLYSGVGFFGLALAKLGHKVVCLEYKAGSLIRALRSAKTQGIAGVSAVAGKAEKVMRGFAARGAKFSAVVVDPPRPGIHHKALEALIALAPPLIVYVSCNPVTLARDLKVLLAGGYSLDSVKGFDLFPQTRHMEAVAVLHSSSCPS